MLENGIFSAEARFIDVALQHQQALQRHMSSTPSEEFESSEEEELDDENILGSMLKSFGGKGGET